MRHPRSFLACALAVALVAGGCSGRSADSATAGAAAVDARVLTLRALPIGTAAVDAATEVLRQVGVGVYPDTAGTGTEPVRLTRWQVRNAAIEAANGGGVRGDVLAELAPGPAGAPPLPYLVAAWVSSFDSPGARFARSLLGQRDWHRADQARFPQLVLVLFLADATRGAPSPAAGGGTGAAVPAAYQRVGVCSAAASFVQQAIAAVANALKVNTSGGGFLGFLGKLWNTAVDLATGVVKGLLDAVTRPVVDLLVTVFGVIATVSQVTLILTQWRVTVTPDPPDNRFGIGSQVLTGQLILRIQTDQLPIPAFIIDCARLVNVDLSDAGSPAGSKVGWTAVNHGRADLTAPSTMDSVLDPDRTARYSYRTGQESEDDSHGDPHTGYVEVTGSVERKDVERLRQLFATLVLDQLPAAIRPLVEPFARPVLDAATRLIAAISDVHETGTVSVSYRTAKEPTATPSGKPIGGRMGLIPTNCPLSSVLGPGYTYLESWAPGDVPPGTIGCWYDRAASYVTIVLYPVPLDINSSLGATPIPFPGVSGAWIAADCGPSCYTLDITVGARGLRVAGAATRDEAVQLAERVLGLR